jgi:carbon monoxide dehydrogenase subunit G
MDLEGYHHTDSITVDAPPEAVYALVADVTRIGEFSSVCRSAEWTDEDHTTFSGYNERGDVSWTMQCRVDVADPGREFTFTNAGVDGSSELVRWSYTFVAEGDTTVVTEHWQVLPGYREFAARYMSDTPVEAHLDRMVAPTRQGIAETLARLKATAEGEADGLR